MRMCVTCGRNASKGTMCQSCRDLAAKPTVKLKKPSESDRYWAQEQAMELGMGLGIDAYNDAMGYGSLESNDEEES